MRHGRQRIRDLPLVVWLLAAVVVALAHRWVPESTWLLIHLVALGAMTHAVLVWSTHFASALLKARPDEAAMARQNLRLWLVSGGTLLVLVGVPLVLWWLVVVGATVVAAAVLWHGWALYQQLRRALPGRFRTCVHYYVAAACCLPVGLGFGVALAFGLDERWHARMLMAHTLTNLLGWIGLTVVGTLVTFWPTVLRTRMDDRSEALARHALPLFLAGLGIAVEGALLGWRWLVLVGILGYAVGLLAWGRTLLAPLRRRPPREFAAASILAGCAWFVVALVLTSIAILRSDDARLALDYPTLGAVWVVGFLAQLLTGALSYLLPSVLGGGPRVVRAGAAWFDRFTTVRLTVINAGLLIWLLPAPSWVRVTVSTAVLVALATFLPLMFGGIRASVAERRRAAAGEPSEHPERRNALTMSGLLAGVAAIAVAVAVGVGVDPSAVGLGRATDVAGDAVATGKTVTVKVAAKDMVFSPNEVRVARGDRVVIELTNEDPTTVHDLQVAGERSKRLAAGESDTMDLGVVADSQEGWCTVVGHRQMGMTFNVIVDGAPAATVQPTTSPHQHTAPPVDPAAKLGDTVDPVLPALTAEKVHKLTLTMTEVPLEVAPGIWQKRWTFGGGSVGPTLHGRVGDVFEITLVNDGSMGHSIDFHAGALAPDKPMRTIAPGERLVYRFTAERAGIWMYHCSTMPMTAHIAAGMHGAVVIEPAEGLPKVDREYVVVQSEVYLGSMATSPGEATEVNMDGVAAERPDKVVFNGVANQYDQVPFKAKVGERVRFWVLDAGPNRASAFHVVGGQFDTTWFEGAYQLRDGKDAFGQTSGGSQALGLQPAQGGFVELVFPEAGHYPVVSHVMVDAERGAHGIVEVTN